MNSPHAHVPFDRIPQYADFIRSRKLNLEIYFSSSVLDSLTESGIHDLKSTLDYGPSLSFHAPFMDLSPGAIDSRVREATLARFHHVLDIAEILGPKAVVFHSGYEKWKYALNIDLWLEKSLMTWRPVNERAADLGVRIAIENIFEDEPTNLNRLMEQMGSENFGVCFDTGHFNLFSRMPLTDWMEALNPYIIELHLHDNQKTYDQHLPMGEGTFDFREFFGLLKNRDCIHTIEAHTPDHVLRSIDYLSRF